ncbi:hypothetical protein BD779DRAFT_1553586 [Infundibulicybe gibba]|nr:hypothetical protein BD779DRAFT_1553586 [Infundibulicybe gibba]
MMASHSRWRILFPGLNQAEPSKKREPNDSAFNPPLAPQIAGVSPLRFGILGAAAIAPIALISPAKSHPEVVVHAVAARDIARAEAYAKKYGIEKFYGGPRGYQELIDDPEIEVIYNPLPNALHFEWTMKALAAGKHVLLEKPSADTADETRQMFALAEEKGLVLLEAFHYRFHPAVQRVKAIIDSGELGPIKHISAALAIPRGLIPSDDIRFNHELGGGVMMDMGCYTMNCLRYLSSSNPTAVISAEQVPHAPPSGSAPPTIDRRTTATLALPNDATAELMCDLGMPSKYGNYGIPAFPQVRAHIECVGGTIELYNFVAPTFYHSITIVPKLRGKKKRVEKVYKFADGYGEDWWTTYRYQLDAFVDQVRGRRPRTWINKEDSIANMEWIEKIYAKTGFGSRPKSEYTSVAR